MFTRIAVFATILLLPALSSAHRDTLIPIEKDGTLARLPKQYQPAKLDIRFERGDGDKRVSFVRLTLGAKEVSLPMCVVYLLNSEELSQIRAKGSWYHERGVLPPYLDVEFYDSGYETEKSANPGYSLLFNLETAQLIRMDVNIVHEREKSIQSVPVDIGGLCTAQEASKLDK